LRGIGVLNSEGNHITGESYFFQLLKKNIPINIIFDVGANTGGYADEVHSYFPKALIYSFEPHPKTFLNLKKIAKKDSVKAYNIALGSKVGKVKLWDFAEDALLKHTQPTSTLASVHRIVIEKLHKQKSECYLVTQNTIDNFVEKEKIDHIDFLKIDTEGSEYDVLVGATKLLKKNKIKIIQFEFNEMNAYSRTFFKDFMDILPDFSFYRLMPRGMLPLGEYRPSTHEIFAFQNIVAVQNKIKSAFNK